MKLTDWAIRDAVVSGELSTVVRIFSETFPELRARLDEKWVAEAIKWTTYVCLDVSGYSYTYARRNMWALSAGAFHREPLAFPPKENKIYFPGAWMQPA
jgi:hypothetical protein